MNKTKLFEIVKLWVFPIVLYFLTFCILTYPLILQFTTHFFADTGDGLQNVWNIWWVNTAVTELHQHPWHTTYIYYPQGTSLLGQTLNPFNGFFGILLLKFLTLIQTHNAIVIFSFVIGGLTAFRLSYSITDSYPNSLIAGYIFTFSQYHFAHAQGHLQLLSLEWIPLFVLCWYQMILKPDAIRAVIAGIVLSAVILCDYYYFFYCVLTAVIIVIWYGISGKDKLFFLQKQYLRTFGSFMLVSLLSSGILVIALLRADIRDPLLGAHNPLRYSADFLSPFIPGGHWRFAHITQSFWSELSGNIHETSVYIGLSVIILMGYAWYKRQELRLSFPSFSLWWIILLFFGIMAFGPTLHIWGIPILPGIMPYALFQTVFPPLKLSGCPARMMVMVMLSGSVISAMGLSLIFQYSGLKRIFTAVIIGFLLLIDFLPSPLPASDIEVPEYVEQLKHLPNIGGLVDKITQSPLALYYQTIHGKPLADGYISRYPTSVLIERNRKYQAIRQHDYLTLLTQYNIRYLLTSSEEDIVSDGIIPTVLYDKHNTRLYRIDAR